LEFPSGKLCNVEGRLSHQLLERQRTGEEEGHRGFVSPAALTARAASVSQTPDRMKHLLCHRSVSKEILILQMLTALIT